MTDRHPVGQGPRSQPPATEPLSEHRQNTVVLQQTDPPDITVPADEMIGRKAREAAVLLPLLGLLMIIPPVVEMFAINNTFLGVPVLAVYIFAVWAGLIIAAFMLSRVLSRSRGQSGGQTDGQTGGQNGGQVSRTTGTGWHPGNTGRAG